MKTTEFTGIRVEVETSLSFDEVNQRLQRSTGQATLQDMIIRNVGGRVTPSTIDTLAMLRQVTRAAGGDLGAGWNLVVLHHTDCGITRLGGAPKLLAGFFGISPDRLHERAIDDPRASVALDIDALRASQEVSGDVVVTGLVYDVATGLVETVVAPSLLRPAVDAGAWRRQAARPKTEGPATLKRADHASSCIDRCFSHVSAAC